MKSCGKKYLQEKVDEKKLIGLNNNQVNVKLYSSYLGQVEIPCVKKSGEYILDSIIKIENRNLLIKSLDAKQHDLSDEYIFNLEYLETLESVKVNVVNNKMAYYLNLLIQNKMKDKEQIKKRIEKFKNEELDSIKDLLNSFIDELFKNEFRSIEILKNLVNNINISSTEDENKEIYAKLIKHNCFIDIHFNTISYLEFLYDVCGVVSINNNNLVVSVGNQDFENAYWNGYYMMYGNGEKQFYPLVSADVVGHELTHGLISNTADLEYKGESGALNEAFADIFGTAYEFWLYEKYNKNKNLEDDILGDSDWFIGEDLARIDDFLRNMLNPLEGDQPKEYKGEKWHPTNNSFDYGGVHINSGVPNYLFYLMCTGENSVDKNTATKKFYDCLSKHLNKKSQFDDLTKSLIKVFTDTPNIDKVKECLKEVKLYKDPVIIPPRPQYPFPRPPLPQYPRPQFPFPRPPFPQYPRPQFPFPRPQFPFPQYPQFPRSQKSRTPFPFKKKNKK